MPGTASRTSAGRRTGRLSMRSASMSPSMAALERGNRRAVSRQHRDTDESPNSREYNRLRALAPEELRTVIEAHVARYLDGIELQFDGTLVRPALSGVEIPSVGEVALSRQTTIRLGAAAPAVAKTLTFSYAARFGSCVIRVREGERLDAMWLKNGERSVPYVL